MSGHVYPDEGKLAASRVDLNLVQDTQNVLPELPRDLLPDILRRLSPKERHRALTHDILPVAWLPQRVFHAVIGNRPPRGSSAADADIVAQVPRAVFLDAVRRVLGARLKLEATEGLRRLWPEFSAARRLTPEQVLILVIFGLGILAVGLVVSRPILTVSIAILFNVFFLLTLSLKLLWLTSAIPRPQRQPALMQEAALPVYTVLVPVFRETRVLPQLIRALSALRYPPEKLDIKLVLEESDTAMQRALARVPLPSYIEAIIVPTGKPQTKPRALAYALKFARGELLTIYDAEDIPEPLQLQKAALKFLSAGPELGCLQAELCFYNPNEGWLARQFTIEYAILFGQLLPSLAEMNLPLPLGGTSNHFRVSALQAVGGWDPYNVTEDADLGFRLARFGYVTATLDSLTYEEANTRLGNWINQRTRWLKGFLQTWLVHTREPARLVRELGLAGTWVFMCSTIAVFASALLYPVFLLLTLWLFTFAPHSEMTSLYGLMVSLSIAVSILGYGLAGYGASLALRRNGIKGWTLTILTLPVYWVLIGIAAWRAVWEFAVQPFHWNKTQHGLSAFTQSQRDGSTLPSEP
jgi:cellulose synthase/poly-beta-1,6-N-acetylglucosamine synthase-like glycosyltransferase